jgi:hypothetical protein
MDTHSQANGTISPPHRGPGLALNWLSPRNRIRFFNDKLGSDLFLLFQSGDLGLYRSSSL